MGRGAAKIRRLRRSERSAALVRPAIFDVFREHVQEAQDVRQNGAADQDVEAILSRRATRHQGVNISELERQVCAHLRNLMETVRIERANGVESDIVAAERAFDEDEEVLEGSNLSGFPRVQKSILNFGFPDLSRVGDPNTNRDTFETTIAKILANYEPRLIETSIEVEIKPPRTGARVQQRAEVYISGSLVADEALRIEIGASIDLAKGCVDAALSDRRHPSKLGKPSNG